MKTLSVIIPAYNEEIYIKETLDEILRDNLNYPFSLIEVVVVDDGSKDDTRSIVEEYSIKNDKVRCEGYGKNKGKGFAVSHGIKKTKGDYKIFLDADGSTHINSVINLLEHLSENDSDIMIGSRSGVFGGEMVVCQPKDRSKLGNIGKKLIKKILRMPINDTQCGCKVFKKDVADVLFSDLKTKSWMFDCEVLYKAYRKEYSIKEFGIIWSNKCNSKVKFMSYFKSFIDLIRIKISNL